MGIDVGSFIFLLQNKDSIKGNVLQLGRQGMHIAWNDKDMRICKSVFEMFDDQTPFNSIFSTGPHADGFFQYLGADVVDSMDYSAFEGASIVHDLNNPVPEYLVDRFDFIFDGGTTEHIFDVKTVMDNIKKMLKVGGVFAGISPSNNCLGHGFYQFSPELYRTVFSKEEGYEILSMQLLETTEIPDFIDIPTPVKGERQELITKEVAINVCYVIRKVEEKAFPKNYQQSDYLKNWGELS